MDNQDVMTFDAQPVSNTTPVNHNPSSPGMVFDKNAVSQDTNTNDLPDPNSVIFHDSDGKNYRVPKSQTKWAKDNGYTPGYYEDTQEYKYKQYGMDVKGKISNAQANAVRQYDIDKGNFTPNTSTAGDMIDNSYEPSDDALKSVGVDPNAYRSNARTAIVRAATGKAVPQLDENGNILGDSGGNPAKGLRTGVTNILSVPSTVYHAFTDDAKNPEEAGRNTVSLGLHRLLVDPNVADLQKSAQAFREGKISQGLGYGATGIMPIVGPAISHTAEAIGQDPIEGTFEGATYLMAPKVFDATKGIVGDLAQSGLSKVSNVAGKAAGNILSTASRLSGQAAGATLKAGVKAGVAAAPYAGDFLAGLGDSLTNAVTDKIVDLTKGTAQDAMGALKNIRDLAVQKLTDNGMSSIDADAAANNLMRRIQDQYIESGNPPSVSGGVDEAGNPTADSAQPTSSVLRDLHGTVSDWVNSLNDQLNVPDDATAIARASNTEAGQGLKSVATPGQMAGGLLSSLERWARQSGEGIGEHIAQTYDAPARAAAEGALNKAIDNVSPQTADWTQADRAGLFSNANLVEGEMPGMPPKVMEALQNLADALGQKGMPMLQSPEQIFKALDKMSPDDFNRSMSGLGPEEIEAVRQGYVRHLADSTVNPGTGNYNLGLMKQIIDQNRGKLGSHWGEFKPLGDGLAELEDHMNTTNTKARSLVATTIGAATMGLLDVLVGGGHPLRIAGLIGGEFLAYKYLAPFAVDLLMKPRMVGDLNLLFRAASKVPEGTFDDKTIKKAANNVKTNFVKPLVKKAFNTIQDKTSQQ